MLLYFQKNQFNFHECFYPSPFLSSPISETKKSTYHNTKIWIYWRIKKCGSVKIKLKKYYIRNFLIADTQKTIRNKSMTWDSAHDSYISLGQIFFFLLNYRKTFKLYLYFDCEYICRKNFCRGKVWFKSQPGNRQEFQVLTSIGLNDDNSENLWEIYWSSRSIKFSIVLKSPSIVQD